MRAKRKGQSAHLSGAANYIAAWRNLAQLNWKSPRHAYGMPAVCLDPCRVVGTGHWLSTSMAISSPVSGRVRATSPTSARPSRSAASLARCRPRPGFCRRRKVSRWRSVATSRRMFHARSSACGAIRGSGRPRQPDGGLRRRRPHRLRLRGQPDRRHQRRGDHQRDSFSTDWDGNWQHAVSEDAAGWTVEMLIPWYIAPMRAAQATSARSASIWTA